MMSKLMIIPPKFTQRIVFGLVFTERGWRSVSQGYGAQKPINAGRQWDHVLEMMYK
jgi:hypothetical protein